MDRMTAQDRVLLRRRLATMRAVISHRRKTVSADSDRVLKELRELRAAMAAYRELVHRILRQRAA